MRKIIATTLVLATLILASVSAVATATPPAQHPIDESLLEHLVQKYDAVGQPDVGALCSYTCTTNWTGKAGKANKVKTAFSASQSVTLELAGHYQPDGQSKAFDLYGWKMPNGDPQGSMVWDTLLAFCRDYPSETKYLCIRPYKGSHQYSGEGVEVFAEKQYRSEYAGVVLMNADVAFHLIFELLPT